MHLMDSFLFCVCVLFSVNIMLHFLLHKTLCFWLFSKADTYGQLPIRYDIDRVLMTMPEITNLVYPQRKEIPTILCVHAQVGRV